MSDDAQLEEDLSFSPRETFSGKVTRPPPGATAITAFSVIYVAMLWVASLALMANVSALRGPSNAVVSPGACLTLVVLGVELWLASTLARGTWRAIGPTARSLLRPFMVLGPWPFIFVVGFAALMLIAIPRMKFAPVKGENWRISQLSHAERHGVTFKQALVRCLEMGDGWAPPTREEVALLTPAFGGRGDERFWLEETHIATGSCSQGTCRVTPMRIAGEGHVAQVVCWKK